MSHVTGPWCPITFMRLPLSTDYYNATNELINYAAVYENV